MVKILFSTLFLLSIPFSQRTVAILDFEARGINSLEAATLTDRFTSEMVKTRAVRLVERNMVDEILTEQGFQQSGCTSDECAVEVGALLGVQFMISGSIGMLGDTYTIDAKMVSVKLVLPMNLETLPISEKWMDWSLKWRYWHGTS